MEEYKLSHLKELEAESIHIIREVAAEFENPVMLYSIGKDSSVMVRLAEKAFYPGKVPFPLMHIDSKWKFKEMIQFRDEYAKKHGWNLIVESNMEAFHAGVGPFTHGSKVHTDLMKTQALLHALDKYKFDAAFGGARRDEDGYYWITGRVDDVLNVSGHRLGTAEIESALVSHPKIAEAAVVGIPHNIKVQAIYAYVTLNHGEEPSPELYTEVRNWVRKEIGPLATPDVLHWTDSLPKTRSGKIMRRILRKIAAGDTSNLGDTSTLADPGVVDKLLEEKQSIAMPS